MAEAGEYAIAVQIPVTGATRYSFTTDSSPTDVTCNRSTGAISGGETGFFSSKVNWGKRKASE